MIDLGAGCLLPVMGWSGGAILLEGHFQNLDGFRGWLWNSRQRHKFLKAKASRDILKFRVSEMAFPGVFKRYFPPRMLVSSEYSQHWEQCH